MSLLHRAMPAAPCRAACPWDLEVGKRDGRIHAFAGVRPDLDKVLTFPARRATLSAALAKLDELADGADFVLGHNLIGFYLPHLQAASPQLRLLQLPAVDTLRLNPLAFPKNPYHYLVKHYQDGQLKRGRVNDPELDARLALEVFENQQRALSIASPDLLASWHWLTTADGGVGFDRLYTALRRSPRLSAGEARDAVLRRLSGASCGTCAQSALDDADRHGWELAYALAWLSVAGGNSVMPPWVRHQFPGAGRLVRRLRDTSCDDSACEWCRERHDARGSWRAGSASTARTRGRGQTASAGHPGHRGRQIALLSAAGPVPLRQDRWPDGGDITAGRVDGRPGGRPGGPHRRLPGGLHPPLGPARGAGQRVALSHHAHRRRDAGHHGVGLLGTGRRRGVAAGFRRTLALPEVGMGRRQQWVYYVEPEEFPRGFPHFRDVAGLTWRGLARSLRVNVRVVWRWKAGASPGHLVSLFRLAAGMGLLHHLLPEAGQPEGEGNVVTGIGNDVYGQGP